MTPRSLFNIILKIFGLFFLKEIVNTVPQLVSFFSSFLQQNGALEVFFSIILIAIILAFYGYISHLLLFKTNNILDKLKLDQGISQQEFSFNISVSKVLTIALIVIVGIILINEIPIFCKELFIYFQENRLAAGMNQPDFSYIIISAFKIIIGLLLFGERKRIISFIEKSETKNHTDKN